MAGVPSGGELLQGDRVQKAGWREGEGAPGAPGRKKGHPRKQDLRKACPEEGGGVGSWAGERISWEGDRCRKEPPRIWISGDKGSPWNRPWERPGEGLWGAQDVGTGAIGALEDGTGSKVSADPRFPFCRCCSVLLSPQLYRDAPIVREHSFLLGGADGPGYGAVAHPGPCRLRSRLVSGPSRLPGILATPGGCTLGSLGGLS